jgi:hypothetical protein
MPQARQSRLGRRFAGKVTGRALSALIVTALGSASASAQSVTATKSCTTLPATTTTASFTIATAQVVS